jgi:hypothetical protein
MLASSKFIRYAPKAKHVLTEAPITIQPEIEQSEKPKRGRKPGPKKLQIPARTFEIVQGDVQIKFD